MHGRQRVRTKILQVACQYRIQNRQPPGMTEHELIRGLTSGNRDAVAYLVETYQKKVIKTAYYYLGDMEEAEDTAQEVFLDIIRSAGKFRGSSAFSTWVYRITVNRSLNAAKRKKRRQIFVRMEKMLGMATVADHSLNGETTPNTGETDSELSLKWLRAAVAGLPDNQRKVFIMSKYDEMSYREISEVTGFSLAAVESLMHRAKINLQKKLSGYGTTTSNGKVF